MNISLIINFGTAALTFVFGLLLITGVIYPGKMDSAKLMFAIVLMIYGIYRFINSFSKVKQAKMEEERVRLNEEREKLLNQK
ncbi:MAG: hypothetical protein IPL53_08025 [Ignavibacteria bacterium]|nr:hypothetical protein [Ignavibacteria bacterium]